MPADIVDDMWDAFIDELNTPETLSIAFSLAGNAIGLNPIINNMIINAVAGAVEGFFENPQDTMAGIFEGMLQNFYNSCVNALTFGLFDPQTGGWSSNWDREYHFMQLVAFIDILQEQGIVAALENYISGVFTDDAIRAINRRGGIADFLTGDAEMINENGELIKKVTFTSNFFLYLDPDTDEIIGRDYQNELGYDIRERGTYSVNAVTGEISLTDGTLEGTYEGTSLTYEVIDGIAITDMWVTGNGQNYEIRPTDIEAGFNLNANGVPTSGIVIDQNQGRIFEFEYDEMMGIIDFIMALNQPVTSETGIDVAQWSSLTTEQKEEVINYYVLMNGIANQNAYTSPRSFSNFADDLAIADPLPEEDITLIPLYMDMAAEFCFRGLIELDYSPLDLFEDLINNGYVERVEGTLDWGRLTKKFYDLENASEMEDLSAPFIDKQQEIFDYLTDIDSGWMSTISDIGRDAIRWCLHTEQVAAEILGALQAKYGTSLPPDMTGVCFSGSGDPFIYLLNANPTIDVNSIVLVGTPLKPERYITNTNVQTVVTIYGDKDTWFDGLNKAFREDFDGTHLFDNSSLPENKIAIELTGIGHTDYFYDPNKPGDDPELAQLRQKASAFIAKVTAKANDSEELKRFLLQTTGVDYDEDNDKYVVDLKKVVY
ncbi:MAG: hypothetical protein HQ575_07180 [Candidatus Omnitrophica bacterium]|nr:hypothetical protein [Candidatus Omnitrophota bacterium]